MILTDAQRRAMNRGLAAANEVLPHLELLERVAEAAPHMQDVVANLRGQREYLKAMCEACLKADQELGS